MAVAVRPERVRLRSGGPLGPPQGPNELPGPVEEMRLPGTARAAIASGCPHGGLWSVDEPAVDEPGHARGAAVTVAWRPEDCRAIPQT